MSEETDQIQAAPALIEALNLAPHPEGGWYRETWRADAEAGKRAQATAIHFLLEAGQRSHWHKVDAAEIWLWHAGDPLLLSLAATDAGPVQQVTLGADILAGHSPQHVIAPHEWQAAEPVNGPHGYTLVSCVVAPAFDFAGFTLADAHWRPGQ
ncbi:cupin domain-containing protein [Alteraurantiacibacter aestuarii]|uniref:Cupin n=1 Tax=Alteraurantiacibacter aestuarii TaxID=650004 RepID=A0A844ZIC4_9SPHN|nr:cupin domain-containing protein [Alteraurantiacibacter aestuarii]MXO87555.1 cupin [Alteraurantiacibacter aestuarii]